LAHCFFSGDGVAANARKAVKWFTRAAEAGNACAQFNLGRCFALGDGVKCDDAMAREWFTRAAARGNSSALAALAELDAAEAA
jgi:TPR repeat protein